MSDLTLDELIAMWASNMTLDEWIAMAERLECRADPDFEERRQKRIEAIKRFNPSGPSAVTLKMLEPARCGHCMLLRRLWQAKADEDKQA
jgi:hypothetical protein